jgi:1,4-alpha-glucan branching enzyme
MREAGAVEVIGTFTQWQKVPLQRDAALGSWHATIHQIPSHKTHHYMLLVDGTPTHDTHSDGLAIPGGPEEEHWAIPTEKGPRVLMLFSMTK